MRLQDKPFWLLTAALGFLAFFPVAMPTAFQIDEKKLALFDRFPSQLGDWKGTEIELEEKIYQILETRNVLSRRYQNARGENVHLLLVGSYRDRRVAHPPEVCYTGSNYTILNESSGTLETHGESIPYKTFLAQNKNLAEEEHVLYVYKIGQKWTTNYYAQQIRFALDHLTRRGSHVLLIRLSGNRPDLFPQFLSEVVLSLPKMNPEIKRQ